MSIVRSFLGVVILAAVTSFASFAQQPHTPPAAAKKPAPRPAIEVVAVDNRIKVLHAPTGSRLEVYSVVGLKVAEIEIKQPCGEYVVNLAKGYYIIRIDETVRKVAIR
ncbi:MAG: hypothetical protein LBP25_02245 [Tannerellaceae bacterium]|nr:hypothetical protein [Tannerellaceae bacterium]